MLRAPFYIAIALAVAFAGGTWSAIEAIKADAVLDVVTIGPWEASPRAQTATATPYAKARRAREGDLPLGQAEGLDFRARTDSAGRQLTAECAYSVSGQTPASRMWILSITDPGGTPRSGTPAFPAAIHSFSLARAADGSFTIHLDGQAQSGNWMKLQRAGSFALHLTLFDTPAAGSFGLVDVVMPEITREGCRDA